MEHDWNQQDQDDEFNQHNDSSIDSRLLSAKNARKKIELDARALSNRIHLLENEEKKVLTKIDETKRKALNVMVIKKRNREHDERKRDWEHSQQDKLFQKKAHVDEMNHELKEGLSMAKKQDHVDSMAKANEVKENLKRLREVYKIAKTDERMSNIQNANNIKCFEKEVERKKREHMEHVNIEAKQRYEDAINTEEDIRDNLMEEIDVLEDKEKELIKRLKNTQQIHQMAVDDMERINKNERPMSVLAETEKDFRKNNGGLLTKNKGFGKPLRSGVDNKPEPFRH